jgi:formate dehydrogenase major subunit
VPGLGTSFGRGGATTFAADLANSDSILIMGSNMAECHPVAFRWVMQAKTRETNPCTVIHVDPRFTRTSAMAQIYAPLRAGSDIVFLGALIKYVLDHLEPILRKPQESLTARERFFRDYLVRYTNAATIITDKFRDIDEDDLSGLFAGFDADGKKYDASQWQYERQDAAAESPEPTNAETSFQDHVRRLVRPPAKTDETLQNERCVFQILLRHYRRYTPELVEDVCGTPRETFLRVAESLVDNSGPDRTGAIAYAVGWTQHTTGVQMIRAAAMLQLLLGNIGRPGGGILALRGHATIQGSTDIATLYHILPGYLRAPDARRSHDSLLDYIKTETNATSYWSNFPAFIVSQLKAWYGDAATAGNDYLFDHMARIRDDHSHLPMFVEMAKGTIKGLLAMGQNPAVGGQNASFQRQSLAKLDWLVVRDLFETETASFWKDSPEVHNGTLKPAAIQTEVFFLPCAAVPEMDGSFTNTQRLIQWHEKAVDPPGDARSDMWFTYHLGRRLKTLYADSQSPRDRLIHALAWEYVDHEANAAWRIKDEPSAELVLKEVNGYTYDSNLSLKESRSLGSFAQLKDDGSTACGAWVYTGVFAPTDQHPSGHNHAANRQGDDWVSLGWGFAWPANRRILYNRAAADPAGNPWPKEKRLSREHAGNGGPAHIGYVYWDEAQGRWAGLDSPDFAATKRPDAAANPGGVGLECHDGASPFLMQSDGKAWLYVPEGLVDGPLPAHYEPYESPVENAVYRQQHNPLTKIWELSQNAYAPVGSADYPHVLSTYRLTEHHLSGSMSRWLPWLAELQPELFCEISPEHAAEIGIQNTDWVQISTPRGAIRAKALVTRRIRPYRLKSRTVHHVGLPWHWGYKGVTTGDVVNDLSALVGEPNTTIHEAKVFVCNVKRD